MISKIIKVEVRVIDECTVSSRPKKHFGVRCTLSLAAKLGFYHSKNWFLGSLRVHPDMAYTQAPAGTV